MSTHDANKRIEARAKGLRLAAKVATIGGLAVAALGLAGARAAAASPAAAHAVASDDARPLPLEGLKVIGGNCGCAPCWGPPAPPAKSGRSRRTARRRRVAPAKVRARRSGER